MKLAQVKLQMSVGSGADPISIPARHRASDDFFVSLQLNPLFSLLLFHRMASSSGSSSGGGGGGGGASHLPLIPMPGSLLGAKSSVDLEVKEQLDQAKAELNNVRVQYLDSKRRCDNAQEKLDYYIQQYTTTMNQLEMAHQDIAILREKFQESSNEKSR